MEKIKRVKNYEKLYSVTSSGNIIANRKVIIGNNGAKILKEETILKPALDGKYLFVVLQNKGIKKHKKVHRLVAENFIPNPDNKPIVNHKDGNKLNNAVENLEWVTASENSQHAVDNGLRKYNSISGELGGLAKISNEQVIIIRDRYSLGETSRKLGQEFGVDKSTILKIVNRKTFKNVR